MSSHPQGSVPSWSRQEFAGLDLGDTRLNDRRVDIIALLSVIAWRLYWMTLLNRHCPFQKLRFCDAIGSKNFNNEMNA